MDLCVGANIKLISGVYALFCARECANLIGTYMVRSEFHPDSPRLGLEATQTLASRRRT